VDDAEAEAIVNDAEAAVVADIDRPHKPWWRHRPPDDGDDFHLSNR
jgi:hypothetical protein